MREMINYIVEVNVALLILLAFYRLVLHSENQFRLQRIFLLVSIVFSLVLPLLHFDTGTQTQILSIGNVVPEYWLPEISVQESPEHTPIPALNTAYNAWQITGWFYIAGVVVFSIWLVMQIGYVWIMVRNHRSYSIDRFRVIESVEDKPSFSFFNLIYIGKSDQLTAVEKEQIIRHESEHARQLHSVDILVVSILGIVFWFNPFINWYKKIFIQLHEFEADARAVENTDVNVYCSLLARVALQAHFPIASHFNESLTVKRIEMMRTDKKKIKRWKLAAMIATFAVAFVFVACQDQIVEEVSKSTISQTGDYPLEVQEHMDKYLKEHPGAKLTYLDGSPEEIDRLSNLGEINKRIIYTYDLRNNDDGIHKKGLLLADIQEAVEVAATSDKVFMVVEEMPEFPGGYPAMKTFLKENLKYPEGTTNEGVVYVSMVIDKDGSVTDTKILRGVDAKLDAAAARAVSMLPKWKPGMQNGMAVRTRFNIPFNFVAGRYVQKQDDAVEISAENDKMKVIQINKERENGKLVIKGRVVDEQGNSLLGVNVIVAGTTSGTTTDSQGLFQLTSPKEKGTVVFTFVGFNTVEEVF
jgi:TonB family protein